VVLQQEGIPVRVSVSACVSEPLSSQASGGEQRTGRPGWPVSRSGEESHITSFTFGISCCERGVQGMYAKYIRSSQGPRPEQLPPRGSTPRMIIIC